MAQDLEAESARSEPENDLNAFHRELAAFESFLPDLLRRQRGRFVAVFRGSVVDEDEDEFALARRMEVGHRNDFVLIRRVAAEHSEDHLLSPETESA